MKSLWPINRRMVVPPIISDSTKPTPVRVASSRLTRATMKSLVWQRLISTTGYVALDTDFVNRIVGDNRAVAFEITTGFDLIG